MLARTAVPLLTTAVLLAGCSGGSGGSGGAAAPATPAQPQPPTATQTPAAPSTTTTSTATTPTTAPPTTTATGPAGPDGTGSGRVTGCPAGGGGVPAGAVTGATGDLDHDGAPDELWIGDRDGGRRLLGVRTASGAVFSTAFSSASPMGASGIGQELDASTSIVLLSDGRQVPLYAVVDCQLVATQNAQGQQYTFDLGFTGYGSGVTCLPRGEDGDLALYGLLVRGGDAQYDVPSIERTRVDLSDSGRRADNGPTETAVPAEQIDQPQIQAARQVRCGSQGPAQAVAEDVS